MSKNLHDLSDEEFDDLFRDAAEKSDIGFDPEAWNKMSQKLDTASSPPSSSKKGGNSLKKWGLPGIILLLLLITGTYFMVRKPSGVVAETNAKAKENSVKQAGKVVEKDVATDKVGTEKQENAKETAIENGKVQPEKTIDTDSQNDTKKTNEALKSIDKVADKSAKTFSPKTNQNQEKNNRDLTSTTQSSNQAETNAVKSSKKPAIASADKKADDKSDTYETGKNSNDELKPASVKNAKVSKYKLRSKPQLTALPEEQVNSTKIGIDNTKQASATKTDTIGSTNEIDGSLKPITQNQTLTVDSAETIDKMQWTTVRMLPAHQPKFEVHLRLPDVYYVENLLQGRIVSLMNNSAFKTGLSLRVALSPDLSFIPSNKIFKVGNNWAAIVEYRFNNRLSVQTGVIRSMKYYGALPSQYEWNAYWTMPSPLKDIDATCKMLDIPLNVRYDISQKPNSRWFVGGGFTSYIMLKEEYRYNYENPYDPNIKRTSWEGKTGAYPFSVLNLSMGYEHQLFRRLTFQAEPFYKAPLGKIGYGKVRLATAGVFFSVKYPF
ncbi:hypothetical protein [Emticicia agri]|uniref:Outer membrane protein beta-barrel domain-containing protein n=1 Tax=Emticicia agri TaxID=2492393 RepID=A0A4Q5M697_9BACT|nr:hypothetical protein [Emticicia agri]RYU97553.1 hypothetical protein EWM59_00080 [Emticicia agri]